MKRERKSWDRYAHFIVCRQANGFRFSGAMTLDDDLVRLKVNAVLLGSANYLLAVILIRFRHGEANASIECRCKIPHIIPQFDIRQFAGTNLPTNKTDDTNNSQN